MKPQKNIFMNVECNQLQFIHFYCLTSRGHHCLTLRNMTSSSRTGEESDETKSRGQWVGFKSLVHIKTPSSSSLIILQKKDMFVPGSTSSKKKQKQTNTRCPRPSAGLSHFIWHGSGRAPFNMYVSEDQRQPLAAINTPVTLATRSGLCRANTSAARSKVKGYGRGRSLGNRAGIKESNV